MQTIKKILVVLILLYPANELFAQIEGASQSRSGSFYSLFGVGYPTDNINPRSLGMGILGVSLDAGHSNSLQNPALWGRNGLTTASSGFNFQQFNTANKSSESVNALLEAGYIQLTFPVFREKLGVSASLYSVTRTNYRFVTFDSTVVSANNVVNYASDIRGTGGVNKMEVGFGWNVNKNIALGYAPAFTFISQNNSRDVFFDQSGYSTNNLDSKITGTALGHRFGALFNFRQLIRTNDRMSLGLSATMPISIDAEENITVRKLVSGQELEVSLRDPKKGKINLPLELKAGLSYYPNRLVN
ncbi:MAG: hypothetical protein WD361_06560, partial [Gracilimonas sp.]